MVSTSRHMFIENVRDSDVIMFHSSVQISYASDLPWCNAIQSRLAKMRFVHLGGDR